MKKASLILLICLLGAVHCLYDKYSSVQSITANEFSQVIIPDVSSSNHSNPVLSSGEVEIWSILIHTGASLRIGKNARLIATEQEEHGYLAWGEGVLQSDTLQQQLNFVSK